MARSGALVCRTADSDGATTGAMRGAARVSPSSNGWLFNLETDGNHGLRLDRFATEQGRTIAPLADRCQRRRNQPFVALNDFEILGNSVSANRGVDEHVALKARFQRGTGIDWCHALQKHCRLQRRVPDARLTVGLNNPWRSRPARG